MRPKAAKCHGGQNNAPALSGGSSRALKSRKGSEIKRYTRARLVGSYHGHKEDTDQKKHNYNRRFGFRAGALFAKCKQGTLPGFLYTGAQTYVLFLKGFFFFSGSAYLCYLLASQASFLQSVHYNVTTPQTTLTARRCAKRKCRRQHSGASHNDVTDCDGIC